MTVHHDAVGNAYLHKVSKPQQAAITMYRFRAEIGGQQSISGADLNWNPAPVTWIVFFSPTGW
jgi:hypothetical protein